MKIISNSGYFMGEYGIKQRNELNRVIVANGGMKNKQCKGVTDNRPSAVAQYLLKQSIQREVSGNVAHVQAGINCDLNQVPVIQKNATGQSQVEIDELSDEDARNYVSDSFKKGKGIGKPIVDQSGRLIQRSVVKESYQGGDLFKVLKKDLDTGTGTTAATRAYVNAPSTHIPSSILFDYATNLSLNQGVKEVKGNDYAYTVDNPIADTAYKSGSYWDAGHKLGRQNGGLGNDNGWVFPQNPAFNQGNSRNMYDVEETRPLWREYEDDFHEKVKLHGAGVWWIKLL